MSQTINLALIIGSLRKASINRVFAEYITSQLPEHVKIEEVAIADLPLYNQDYDNQTIESEPPRLYRRVYCLSQVALSDSLRLS